MKSFEFAKKIMRGLFCLLYAGFFALCCYSWTAAKDAPVPEEPVPAVSKPLLGGTPEVRFSAGSFPVDTRELALVLQPGEVSLLDSFTELTSLDLSGSSCYEEFFPWIQAHPEVSVRYNVTLPGDYTVEGDTETLNLIGLNGEVLAETEKLLPYLPKLKTLELGSEQDGAALTGADILALRQTVPEAEIRYSFTVAGQEADMETESLDLSEMSRDQVPAAAEMLSCMDKLTYVDLGGEESGELTWEDVGAFQAANPNTGFLYRFSRFGKDLTTLDEALDFNHIEMDDGGAAVREILPYMQYCTTLDMDFCGVSNSDMAAIREDFPNIKVIWRIWFGEKYSVRTDTERILASKPSKGGVLDDDEVWVLQYCSDVKYLDLGHNEAISDLSFVYGMPNLEVLVIAMNPVEDITPLASCPHLEYLEIQTTNISDLTPLSGAKELRHLNIANCENLTDLSPLFGLTELERLWIGSITPIPAEQVATMQEAAPECEINTEVGKDPTAGRWRIAGYTELSLALFEETGWLQEVLHPRYELLRKQLGYDGEQYSFSWNDPLYNPHG